MKKLVLLAGSLTFAGVMLSARAYTGKALSNHAQVTMEQARAIALRAYPGKRGGPTCLDRNRWVLNGTVRFDISYSDN